MSIERKPLSDLVGWIDGLSDGGLSLAMATGNNGGGGGRYLQLKHANGEILCGWYVDDTFDCDGNRFMDDLS